MSFVSEIGYVVIHGGGDNCIQSNVALNNNVVDSTFNYGRKELDQNKQEDSNAVPGGWPLSGPSPPGTTMATFNSSRQGRAPGQSQNLSPGLIVNENPATMNHASMLLQSESTPPATDNIFSNEFIQSAANGRGEFVDVGLFRRDRLSDFERDFGHWFLPDDEMGFSLPQRSTPLETDNIFSNESIQSVASGLDEFVDVGLFRGDGDLDFERDFGQWFNPDDAMGMELGPDLDGDFWQWFKASEYED
ncbi:hypothetical protein C8R47DRAFT_1322969 [Mycena vitilis]|nr:hypothetical protein C8R47DRAFT_1322969 [Mycena vitilis]